MDLNGQRHNIHGSCRCSWSNTAEKGLVGGAQALSCNGSCILQSKIMLNMLSNKVLILFNIYIFCHLWRSCFSCGKKCFLGVEYDKIVSNIKKLMQDPCSRCVFVFAFLCFCCCFVFVFFNFCLLPFLFFYFPLALSGFWSLYISLLPAQKWHIALPLIIWQAPREAEVCGEFGVLIGYPSGQDGVILPARDYPFRSRK